MAEFCLKCFNEMNDTKLTDKEVFLEDDLCEGCGKIKVNLILIHAQDHLMNAILCQDLAREIISLRKELHA